MDLGAFANIENLDELAKLNGIDVPRLRGYRLMSKEKKIYLDKDFFEGLELDVEIVSQLCDSCPFWDAATCMYEFSRKTRQRKKYYINTIKDGDEEKEFVRWDRIHGRKRKILKTAIHNRKKEIIRQFEVFNKYVGRDDILYIHARIGGGNWPYYYKEVVNQPWFIEKVDDYFDSTYCDIYAKIENK